MPYIDESKYKEMLLDNIKMQAALDEIGRLASLCCSDMQGRLVDDEHRRAFSVLRSINGQVSLAYPTVKA